MNRKLLLKLSLLTTLCFVVLNVKAQTIPGPEKTFAFNETADYSAKTPLPNNGHLKAVSETKNAAAGEKRAPGLLLRKAGIEPIGITSVSPRASGMDIYREIVSGTVTDAGSGEPLPGVAVQVKGTTIGAATGADGSYSVNAPSLQDTLLISFIGYKTQTIPISGRTTINVALESSVTSLDDLVVIGFGTQTRRNLVGSVASVDSSAMSSAATSTIERVLEGRVAGLQLNAVGGEVGAPTNIQIRGTSSINASSQPLFVIDGIPLVSQEFGLATYGATGGGTNPLLNINPDDIQSIEVLKDASATAIYGTRGSNGVILITTKQGTQGKPKLNISVSSGFSTPTAQYKTLNTADYLKIRNYRLGTTLDPNDFPDINWLDIITRTGSNTKYSASLSGGTADDQYYISAYYDVINGYVIENGNKKFGTRVSLRHRFNDRLRVEVSLDPSFSDFQQLWTQNYEGHPYTLALLEPPMVPLYTPSGEYNDGKFQNVPGNEFSSFAGTPYTDAVNQNINNRITQIIGSESISYDILDNLTFKSKFGIQRIESVVNVHNKSNTVTGYPSGTASARSQTFNSYNFENTLNYKHTWDNGQSLEATLGATFESSTDNVFGGTGANMPSDEVSVISTTSQVSNFYGTNSSYRFQNNLARLTYTFNDRYIVTATGSYNGTSRFASGKQYGFFPSLGLAWIVSDEGFMQGVDFINFLKLRTSYGITGNANIGDFQYAGLIGSSGKYFNNPAFAVTQIGNSNLGWESSGQLDFSLEFQVLDSRLSGTFSYYRKTNDDLLLAKPVSNLNGFTTIFENLGSMLNQGIEFSLDADIVKRRDFNWSLFANIATNKNEVTKLPGGTIFSGNSIVQVGKPIGSFYLPEYRGVDPANGDALYTAAGGGTTNSYGAAPRKIAGDSNPDFFGGFGTNLAYKGFDLGANFQYSSGAMLYWQLGQYMESGGFVIYNQLEGQQNFWTPTNTDAPNPEPRTVTNGSSASTRYLSDASFIRLKSLDLGYNIPARIAGSDIRVFVQGINLLTFTNYKGIDPQTTNTGSNIAQGVNYFNLPQSKSWIFGVNIKL